MRLGGGCGHKVIIPLVGNAGTVIPLVSASVDFRGLATHLLWLAVPGESAENSDIFLNALCGKEGLAYSFGHSLLS